MLNEVVANWNAKLDLDAGDSIIVELFSTALHFKQFSLSEERKHLAYDA